MTEKATERLKLYSVKQAPHIIRDDQSTSEFCRVSEVYMDRGERVRRAELIVKAVNNYDELASIAGEMAGALNTTLNEIRMNYGTPTREGFYCGDFGDEWTEQIDALSRYNKWAEKQQ